MVITKRRARHMHSIVPNQKEWLSVLVCVNAVGEAIPFFYTFRGKRFQQNYIEHCEPRLQWQCNLGHGWPFTFLAHGYPTFLNL
jgi:hypothetical protein